MPNKAMMKSTEQTSLIGKQTVSKRCAYWLLFATVILICGGLYYFTSNAGIKTIVSLRQKATDVKEVSITLHPDDIYHLEMLDVLGTDDEWMNYHLQVINSHGYKSSDESVLYTFTMYDHNYDKEYYHKKYGFTDGTFMTDPIEPYHGEQHHGHMNVSTSPQATPTPKPTRPKMIRTPRPTKKVGKPPRPTQDGRTSTFISNGGLQCYFRYSLLESKNVPEHVLRCIEGDGSVMMVCMN